MTVTDNSVRRYRGRLPPKHFKARAVAPRPVGTAPTAGVFGCYGMFDALGGNWLQLQVGRCFGASTAKAVSFYQYGQTGTPVRISMDWCYTGALEEQRRVELAGSDGRPTFAQLEANPLTDTGSEPAAGWARFKVVGFDTEANWPSTTGFNTRELDLGGEVNARIYVPDAVGQVQIVASGADIDAAVLAALSPFADGKLGQSVQVSIASATQAFDYADGSSVLTAADFNGADFDHSVDLVGTFPSDLLRGVMPSLPSSITGNIDVLSNHWEDWCPNTMVPEIVGGVFTGRWIPMPGCALVDSSARRVMADFSTIGEAA